MPIVIERLEDGAWARFREIRMAALRDAPDAFGTTYAESVALSEADWAARLHALPVFVARLHGKDCGLARGMPSTERADTAHVVSVWVPPDARRHGAGAALMAAVTGWARGEGFARLVLDVNDANPAAIAFYERLDFRPTGRLGAFPPPRAHITEHERELKLEAP